VAKVNSLPRLYPIIDRSHFNGKPDAVSAMLRFAEQLFEAGVTLIQYRDKNSPPQLVLSGARELRRITHGRAKFILNDYPDLCLSSQADGVHLGQDDLTPAAARRIFNAAKRDQLWIGFSTHNLEQVRVADAMPIDYLAVGPVFMTSSKVNPDPVIGLDGVKQARLATSKPLVAIGGITRDNCAQVREAGADCVAVISGLLESPAKAVEDFLHILR
jgi:thiamine-phosphate pyrophosphorylase